MNGSVYVKCLQEDIGEAESREFVEAVRVGDCILAVGVGADPADVY